MDRRLLGPRWLIAHLVVLLVATLFIALGFWQMGRLDDRRMENAVGEERLGEEPVPLEALLESTGELDTIEHRRVTATGRFDPSNEVLIRSQVFLGASGFHLVTPLVGEGGEAILVNRGWVPAGADTVPVEEALPPTAEVKLLGWIHLTQERPALGPSDPSEGRLIVMNRVDVARIQQQIPYLVAGVYVVEIAEQGSDLPVPTDLPSFDDDGPHLGYAIQWFGFAVIGVVGYIFLARRQLGRSG